MNDEMEKLSERSREALLRDVIRIEARAESAEAERDEAIKTLGKEGKLRGQAEAERDALKEQLKREIEYREQMADANNAHRERVHELLDEVERLKAKRELDRDNRLKDYLDRAEMLEEIEIDE